MIQYRIHLVDLNGREYYTQDELMLGDAFEVEGQLCYAGGKMLTNGDFDLGFTDWTGGTGRQLAEPQFQVVGDGGFKGGPYLQAHLNGSANSVYSVKKVVTLEPGQSYVFRIATRNGGNNVKFFLSADGSALTKQVAKATNQEEWNAENFIFNSETNPSGILVFYSLAAKAQIDGVQLRQLFPSREVAMADGMEKAYLRAQSQQAYNTEYPSLNDDLSARISVITGTDEAAPSAAETALAEHMAAVRAKAELKVTAILKPLEQNPCLAYNQMIDLLNAADEATTAQEVLASTAELKALMDKYLVFTRSSKQPRTPSFAGEKSTGWTVKAGTYKDGDQRTATKFGKTCWNAWWSTNEKGATMEINQTLTNLTEGYYRLECKATTEHFCISDQHAFLKNGSTVAVSPTLSKGYFDLPISDVWDTLTTAPIYVEDGGSLTLGFVSSKNGAQTGKWHSFGNATATSDNREGWWCATDFVLRYHAIDEETGICLTADTFPVKGESWYDLSGRRVSNLQLPKGIYIKVEDGKARKMIVNP